MFLSHNPVTPAKTSPCSPSDSLNAAQLLLCFGLIAQQQQRIKCLLRTVCPQRNPIHFVHCLHHMGQEQMLLLKFRALTSYQGNLSSQVSQDKNRTVCVAVTKEFVDKTKLQLVKKNENMSYFDPCSFKIASNLKLENCLFFNELELFQWINTLINQRSQFNLCQNIQQQTCILSDTVTRSLNVICTRLLAGSPSLPSLHMLILSIENQL